MSAMLRCVLIVTLLGTLGCSAAEGASVEAGRPVGKSGQLEVDGQLAFIPVPATSLTPENIIAATETAIEGAFAEFYPASWASSEKDGFAGASQALLGPETATALTAVAETPWGWLLAPGLLAEGLLLLAVFVGNEAVTTPERNFLRAWAKGYAIGDGNCRETIEFGGKRVTVCLEEARRVLTEAGLLVEGRNGDLQAYYPGSGWQFDVPWEAKNCHLIEAPGSRSQCQSMAEIRDRIVNPATAAADRLAYEFIDLEGGRWSVHVDGVQLKFTAKDRFGKDIPFPLGSGPAAQHLVPAEFIQDGERDQQQFLDEDELEAVLKTFFERYREVDPKVRAALWHWLLATLQAIHEGMWHAPDLAPVATIASHIATTVGDYHLAALARAVAVAADALYSVYVPQRMPGGPPHGMNNVTQPQIDEFLNQMRRAFSDEPTPWQQHIIMATTELLLSWTSTRTTN